MRFVIHQANSSQFLRRRSNGWATVRDINEATLYDSRTEATDEYQDFHDWLNIRREGVKGDFYYPDGYWCSWQGGLNVIEPVNITLGTSK